MKNIFNPFAVISKKNMLILIAVQVALALLFWHLSSKGSVIPGPLKVGEKALELIKGDDKIIDFWGDFVKSITLAFKGLGISLIVALIISYLAMVPFFKPIAQFIIKCRYLPIAGFVFLFTILSTDGGALKTNMLVFGIVPFFVTSFLSAIDAIDKQEFELCTTMGMSRWRTLWEVVIIGRLDLVLEVMRQNFAIAWMMITTVEGFNLGEGGLGADIIKASKYVKQEVGFSLMIAVFLVGVFFDYILGMLRYWLFPYTKLQIRKQ
jgi:ABC-type nitrate/sulfonate/bicarbonate transport system permease component